MGELTIKTDRKWKPFRYQYDVERRKDYKDYDWMDEEDKGCNWIVYRKQLYHACDFMRIDNMPEFKGWHGYSSDSFFSGILIRISDDGEMYQIGTYIS